MTLKGSNFIPGATTVAVSGQDVTVSSVSVSNATTLTATFDIGAAAAAGFRDVTVAVNGTASNTQTLAVVPSGFVGTPTQLEVSLYAGGTLGPGHRDGIGTAAQFWYPYGLWGDATNLYVGRIRLHDSKDRPCDRRGHHIRGFSQFTRLC